MHDIIDRQGICDKCGPYHGKLNIKSPEWNPGYCFWCWYHGNPITEPENFGLKLATTKGIGMPNTLKEFTLRSFSINSPKDSLIDLTGRQKKSLQDAFINALFHHGYVYSTGEDQFILNFMRLDKFETLDAQLEEIGIVLQKVLKNHGITFDAPA